MRNPHISVAVETSLNVPFETVESLTEIVDYWIVDVKDMNNNIYFAYTGHSNVQVLSNLKYLAKLVPTEKIQCRVPLIEGYNTEADVQKATEELQELGVQNIERLVYKI
jgi:pyruvate formate lyase activating enzyme